MCLYVCLGVVKHTQPAFLSHQPHLSIQSTPLSAFTLLFSHHRQASFFRTDHLWHYQSDSSCSVYTHQAFPRQAGVTQSRPQRKEEKQRVSLTCSFHCFARLSLKAYTFNIPQHPLRWKKGSHGPRSSIFPKNSRTATFCTEGHSHCMEAEICC